MKILFCFFLLSAFTTTYGQSDSIKKLPTMPNEEYIFYYYDSSLQAEVLSYNYSGKWDLDGDKINDSIWFIGNGGAHVYYHLRIKLSTGNITTDFPTFLLDMPYPGTADKIKNHGKYTPLQFVVHDFDNDGINEMYLNINNSMSSIPKNLKKDGVTSPYVLIDFSANQIKVRNFE